VENHLTIDASKSTKVAEVRKKLYIFLSTMKTYVALLRGINVSGQKKILMADLVVQLTELGWEGVHTYIQSGNIVFQSAENHPLHLAQQTQQKLEEKYGFDVPALVLESWELSEIISNNPFYKDPETVKDRLYVTFLFDTPRAELAEKLQETERMNEHFILDDKIIFLYYPDGYGRAVMNNNAFEKALQVEATSRNWKTVSKLYEMTSGQ
jgi:uncharacterized protein (DUF1697 family)